MLPKYITCAKLNLVSYPAFLVNLTETRAAMNIAKRNSLERVLALPQAAEIHSRAKPVKFTQFCRAKLKFTCMLCMHQGVHMFYQFCMFLNSLLVNTSGTNKVESTNEVIDPVYKALDIIMPVALGIVLLSGTLYAIAIGVQYSKAESADDRNKAKKKLINGIIGFGIVLVLVAVLYAIKGPLGDFIAGA